MIYGTDYPTVTHSCKKFVDHLNLKTEIKGNAALYSEIIHLFTPDPIRLPGFLGERSGIW